jgi:hypothetical protein
MQKSQAKRRRFLKRAKKKAERTQQLFQATETIFVSPVLAGWLKKS